MALKYICNLIHKINDLHLTFIHHLMVNNIRRQETTNK